MQDRFKFRIIIKNHYDTINGKFQGLQVYYCNGFCQGKIKTYFFGNNKRYSFLNSQIASIEQCTGIKDKNGKLIYEGDIVRSEEYPSMSRGVYNYSAEVLWDDDGATFYYYTFKNKNSDVRGISTGNTGDLYEYEWEVIGNIYENKELLEVENNEN